MFRENLYSLASRFYVERAFLCYAAFSIAARYFVITEINNDIFLLIVDRQ